MKSAQIIEFSKAPFHPLLPKVSSRFIAGEKLMLVEHRIKQGHVAMNDAHENEQLTLVLRGKLKFTIHDQTYIIDAGNAILIPSKIVHSCEVIEDSEVLEIFSPIRQEWLDKLSLTERP